MEDRAQVIASYQALSTAGIPVSDGIIRSYAGVYDGHNGARAAEHACDRCLFQRIVVANLEPTSFGALFNDRVQRKSSSSLQIDTFTPFFVTSRQMQSCLHCCDTCSCQQACQMGLSSWECVKAQV